MQLLLKKYNSLKIIILINIITVSLAIFTFITFNEEKKIYKARFNLELDLDHTAFNYPRDFYINKLQKMLKKYNVAHTVYEPTDRYRFYSNGTKKEIFSDLKKIKEVLNLLNDENLELSLKEANVKKKFLFELINHNQNHNQNIFNIIKKIDEIKHLLNNEGLKNSISNIEFQKKFIDKLIIYLDKKYIYSFKRNLPKLLVFLERYTKEESLKPEEKNKIENLKKLINEFELIFYKYTYRSDDYLVAKLSDSIIYNENYLNRLHYTNKIKIKETKEDNINLTNRFITKNDLILTYLFIGLLVSFILILFAQTIRLINKKNITQN